jgi:membrane protease YdiL (CAAX protease family)
MPEKVIALVVTIMFLLAMVLWVPFLDLLRNAVTKRETFAVWIRRIFIGADGLRAGWSFALFYTMCALLQQSVLAIFRHLHRLNPDELRHIARYPSQLLITEGIPFLAVAFATFLMSRIERRSLSAYGIGRTQGAAKQFLGGLFWGASLLSILVFILWLLHLLVFDGLLLSGTAALRFAVEWALGFICVALFEESISRGFIQFTLSRGIAGPLRFTRAAPYATVIGFWATAIFTSYLFGSGHSHNTAESTIGLWTAGLFGFVLSFSLWRTGSLWWAIGIHTSWDWAQSFLFGVADSGHIVAFHLLGSHPQGSPYLSGALVGPEGSIFAIPVIASAAVAVLLTLRKAGWPAPGSRLADPPFAVSVVTSEAPVSYEQDLSLS